MSRFVAHDQLPSYATVIPARDEAAHLARTLDALLAQSHPPASIVVVDDGSEDATATIADRYAANDTRIRVLRRPRAQGRARGAPIVRAFNAGLELVPDSVDILVKLDADLYLPPHYFEWVAATFRDEPRSGIVGGLTLVDDGRQWRLDTVNTNTVAGVAKAYRRACFDDIGGLQPSMGWDGIDEYAARARGWDVHVLSELQILHYAVRGSKQSWRRARWEEGRGAHFMGYRPSFVLLRMGYRMLVERPPLLGGLVLGLGWCASAIRRAPRVPDELAVRQLRREQGERLRALLRLRRRSAAWKSSDGPAYRQTATGPDNDEGRRPD